jgi:hypothetical protein
MRGGQPGKSSQKMKRPLIVSGPGISNFVENLRKSALHRPLAFTHTHTTTHAHGHVGVSSGRGDIFHLRQIAYIAPSKESKLSL